MTIVLLDQQQAHWWAFAIGDTCLFHLFQQTSHLWDYTSFPLKNSDDFTNAPATITSHENAVQVMYNSMKITHNPYKQGDILLLATDALAEWLLEQLEQQRIMNIIRLLNTLTNEAFAQFVDRERTQRRMKDDDTSLVIIHL